MLRLVQLIAIAAIGTVSSSEATDLKTAQSRVDAWIKSLKGKVIEGKDMIEKNKFEMPGLNGFIPTYADIIAAPADYCNQCVFSGGAWTAATEADAAKCTYQAQQLDILSTGHLGLKVPVKVDNTLSYKSLFEALNVCAGTTQATTQTIVQNGDIFTTNAEFQADTVACESTFDLPTFTAGKATGVKGDVPSSFSYKWKVHTATTAGDWCFMSTILPSNYLGGLSVNHTADADTNVIIHVNSGLTNDSRYFNQATLKSNARDHKDYNIGLLAVDRVDIFMAQASKFTYGNTFLVTFTRATVVDIGRLCISTGGVLVTIVIIIILIILFIPIYIMLQKKHVFYQEDKYVRV